jgi:hypothetical protein
MSFSLFLYFLELEFYRYERSPIPFSLLSFSIAKDSGRGIEPLNISEVKKLGFCIDDVKRKIDLLGHFQNADFGMILPCTDAAGAKVFANRLMEIICKSNILSESPVSRLLFAGGVASFPEDSMKVELLLPATIEAKNKARQTGRGVVPFSELYKNE